MPTLDDAPTVETLETSGTGSDLLTSGDSNSSVKVARGDLIQIFDVSEQKVKTITVQALLASVGGVSTFS